MKIQDIEKRITSAEESYRNIIGAWDVANEINSRIDSLLVLARELRRAEDEGLHVKAD